MKCKQWISSHTSCTTRPACHLDVVQAKDAVVGRVSLPIAAAGDMGVGDAFLICYNKEQSNYEDKLDDRILWGDATRATLTSLRCQHNWPISLVDTSVYSSCGAKDRRSGVGSHWRHTSMEDSIIPQYDRALCPVIWNEGSAKE